MMREFELRVTVSARLKFNSIEHAVEWMRQATVFDYLDAAHSDISGGTVHDPKTGEQLGEE